MADSSWLRGYRAFWFYNLARIGMFAVLCLILWAVGVPLLFAALIAAVISAPLSWFLLAKPREAFARTIQARVEQRHERNADLGKRLEGESTAPAEDSDDLPPGVSETPGRGRAKRR